MASQYIGVLNAGSSSLKFAVHDAGGSLRRILSGEVEGIGGLGLLRISGQRDAIIDVPDHGAALARVPMLDGLLAFGHRVVHGGPDLAAPVIIDPPTMARIEAVSPLAPLHNPPALAVIRAMADRFPGVPQVACFDTSFHRGHPAVADRFAIPDSLYQEGVRRYGFHGLSYEHVATALHTVAPAVANGRVVVAHLGSGASMCGLVGGRSVDSSMGFTALDGLPMGTRSGSLDAGVILWLQQHKGWSVRQVEQFLYHDCGLKGLSGVSNDMRVLLASEAPLARLAVDYFVFHVARTAGALAASTGGLDAMVFTAGIGERSPEIRARVLRRLAWMGFEVDDAANQTHGPVLTTSRSQLPAYSIPTDEEGVIARHTAALVMGSNAQVG